jgi:hypothetical protein
LLRRGAPRNDRGATWSETALNPEYGISYNFLRRRRIKADPSKPEASNASEPGSGAVATFSVTGVIVPVKFPAPSKVSAVIKAVV